MTRTSSKGMHFVNAGGQTLLVRGGIDGQGRMAARATTTFTNRSSKRSCAAGARRARCSAANVRSTLPPTVRLVLADVRRRSTEVPRAGWSAATARARRCAARSAADDGPTSACTSRGWWSTLLCERDSPRVKALPDYTVQHCDPARPMTVVNVGGGRHRWEIMLMPGDDPGRMADPDIFWPMMARWVGPDDARIERAAVYTFHSVVQEGWRREKLLLAGDACHQTPPFLGQGMCAGMRDASNLAWKLVALLGEGAPESLLDTYESERLPHVRAFIELAVKLGAVLQETDPAAAAARDARFAAGAQMFDFPQPQLGPGCRTDAPPPVGTIFPQPRLADGRLMDKVIGQRFAIVGGAEILAGLETPAALLPGIAADSHGSTMLVSSVWDLPAGSRRRSRIGRRASARRSTLHE
jgi:3-(3-hydroxy-phenyl)propionate hydroxylase